MEIKNKVLIILSIILACTTSLFLVSSQSNEILAYSLQDINVDSHQGQIEKASMDKNVILNDEVQSKIYSNPRFVVFDNQSGMVNFGLRSYWQDSYNSCKTNFKCTDDTSTTWKNNTSLRLSTTNNTNNTWTSIQGRQIFVEQNQSYTLVTHMKLNNLVIQSHVAVEGFNDTSNEWYQITQCPSGLNGPLEWKEFSCIISISGDTTKIRPVLNAGWSSKPNNEATTWFDSFYITKTGYMTDPKLKVEKVSQKLDFPTGIAFLGYNDILTIEKDKGTVQRIVNGVKLDKPLLDLDVRNNDGLLAIATNKNVTVNKNGIVESVYVYLYFSSAI